MYIHIHLTFCVQWRQGPMPRSGAFDPRSPDVLHVQEPSTRNSIQLAPDEDKSSAHDALHTPLHGGIGHLMKLASTLLCNHRQANSNKILAFLLYSRSFTPKPQKPQLLTQWDQEIHTLLASQTFLAPDLQRLDRTARLLRKPYSYTDMLIHTFRTILSYHSYHTHVLWTRQLRRLKQRRNLKHRSFWNRLYYVFCVIPCVGLTCIL